jgi:hypothetical protein
MTNKVNTIVIIPKGTLSNMINVMLSYIIYTKHKKIPIKMIWENEINYDNLFLNEIECIQKTKVLTKEYFYNPDSDQKLLCKNIEYCENSNLWIVVETDQMIEVDEWTKYKNEHEIKQMYSELLTNMAGFLIGNINLVDFPKPPFCVLDDDGKMDISCNLLNIDRNIFELGGNTELEDYIIMLAYSKADILISTHNNNNTLFNEVSKMCYTMIIYTKYELDNSFTLDGYTSILNPNYVKLSLLL